MCLVLWPQEHAQGWAPPSATGAKADERRKGSIADAVVQEARALGVKAGAAAAADGSDGEGGGDDAEAGGGAERAGTELLAPIGSARAAISGGFKGLGLNDWLVRPSRPRPL